MKIKTEKEKLLMKKRSFKEIIHDVIDDKYKQVKINEDGDIDLTKIQ